MRITRIDSRSEADEIVGGFMIAGFIFADPESVPPSPIPSGCSSSSRAFV